MRIVPSTILAVLVALPVHFALAETPRVAVIQSKATSVPKYKDRDLEDTAAEILASVSSGVIPRAEVHAALADCDAVECGLAIGRRIGATHVLTIDAAFDDSKYRYRYRVELWDVSTRNLVERASGECPVCGLSDLFKDFRQQLTSLVSRTLPTWSQANTGRPGALAPGQTPEPPNGANLDPGQAKPKDAPPPLDMRRTYAIVGLGAGAVSVVAAAVLYFGFDGHNLSCEQRPLGERCLERLDTKPWSLGLAGAGVLGMAASAYFLWLYHPHGVAVGFTGNGAYLSGAF